MTIQVKFIHLFKIAHKAFFFFAILKEIFLYYEKLREYILNSLVIILLKEQISLDEKYIRMYFFISLLNVNKNFFGIIIAQKFNTIDN